MWRRTRVRPPSLPSHLPRLYGRRRVLAAAVAASTAGAADPPPKLLRFAAPAEIECCQGGDDEADFSYRLNHFARRVTIAIERRPCATCKFVERGRFHASPPHPPVLPMRLYAKLRPGTYRAWARAERGTLFSPKFRFFRVSLPTHDG